MASREEAVNEITEAIGHFEKAVDKRKQEGRRVVARGRAIYMACVALGVLLVALLVALSVAIWQEWWGKPLAVFIWIGVIDGFRRFLRKQLK